ncbi:hypothetical protein [Cryptosporangium phraense]|uniref:FtsK domain-containing protein n=1 Tax=Cryptosporangium phraense TaxID=2593070 RepID=A0A545AEE7_9ACTN|nr:hypothetical protein [Cryptosporangium phraense]TQS39708.1 hypothetical protein FL583_38720 [Cryptosporangium phraense]
MVLLLGYLIGQHGPLRFLWALLKFGVWLVCAVAWLGVLFTRPAAAVALSVAWVLLWMLWRMRARVWALVWRLWGHRISVMIPRRVWMWHFQFNSWPRLVFRLGLVFRDGHGLSRLTVQYPRGRWTLADDDNGWTVVVNVLDGQSPADFIAHCETFAEAWGVHHVAGDSPKRGTVRLRAYITDPLRTPLAAPPIPAVTNFKSVLLGMREDGHQWRERLLGRHLFIGAATGGGKGSVQWAVIRALCPAIRAGAAEVWTVDPKAVEFAKGRWLFKEYATSPEEIVDLVEKAAALVATRRAAMAGGARTHVPVSGDPYVLLNIDELAACTVYMTKDLIDRFNRALGLILTQGRSLSVSVMAAVQDPRKEIVPMRQLFTTRIVLRVDEAGQADLVLGGGATARGAHAHLIPADEYTGAGIGYVHGDNRATPMRVRAGYTSDSDIDRMCLRYAPAPTGP